MKPQPVSRSSALSPELLIGQADFVRALSRNLLADSSAADDVAQEALVTALERPPGAAGSLRAWLTRVVRNLVHERQRGEVRRAGREASVARAERIPSTAEVLEREAVRTSVVRAVLALDEPYRTVILLRFYENQAPREIAALLALPIDTVHTRTKRALAHLRARLDREYGGAAWGALLLPLVRSPLPRPALPFVGPFFAVLVIMTTQTKIAVGLVVLALVTFLLLSRREEHVTPVGDLVTPVTEAPELQRTTEASPLVTPPMEDSRSSAAVTSKPQDPIPVATITPSVGSLHLTVTWSDGLPAPGITARATDVGRSSLDSLEARTDTSGQCSFSALRAGKVSVYVDRKQFPVSAQIEAGVGTELAIQLERGFDLEGLVVDSYGGRVAGAEVWSGELGGNTEASFMVAITDSNGAFELRSFERVGLIWARAQGFVQSLCSVMGKKPAGAHESVMLELRGASAMVAGRVIAPDGRPVEGAQVLVGGIEMRRGVKQTLPNGQEVILTHAGPTSVRTNAEGRFSVVSVEPGTVPLGVIPSGLATWRGSLVAKVGETTEIEIQLEPGFRVSGTLRDSSGNPVAGRIEVLTSCTLLSPTLCTGADGSFAFDGLAPGSVRLTATGHEGEAWTTLIGAAGEELSWDAKLGPSHPPTPTESQPWGR